MSNANDAHVPLEIGPQEFDAMRREGKAHVAVDVREKWELDVCAISDVLQKYQEAS